MKRRGISIVGLIGLSIGFVAWIIWICVSQLVADDNVNQSQSELEPFVPSETISPNQVVDFPTDI